MIRCQIWFGVLSVATTRPRTRLGAVCNVRFISIQTSFPRDSRYTWTICHHNAAPPPPPPRAPGHLSGNTPLVCFRRSETKNTDTMTESHRETVSASGIGGDKCLASDSSSSEGSSCVSISVSICSKITIRSALTRFAPLHFLLNPKPYPKPKTLYPKP